MIVEIPQLICCGISTKSEILMTRPTTPTTARLSPDHRPSIGHVDCPSMGHAD
jgi:hypothetical protein